MCDFIRIMGRDSIGNLSGGGILLLEYIKCLMFDGELVDKVEDGIVGVEIDRGVDVVLFDDK